MDDSSDTIKAETPEGQPDDLKSKPVNGGLDPDCVADEVNAEEPAPDCAASEDTKHQVIKPEETPTSNGSSKRKRASNGRDDASKSSSEIEKRNDGYSTSALDPAIFSMLSSLVKQKITKEKPHFCMFCGKQFFNGSGLYIHYYRHKATNSLTQTCRPRTVKEVEREPSKDVVSKIKKPSPQKARVVNGKTSTMTTTTAAAAVTTTSKVVAAKQVASKYVNVEPATSSYSKPFPTKILPAKTLKMLQDLLKQKITPEKPHLCNVCKHPFYSGCGIYIHYLKHAKKSAKQVSKKDTRSSLANTKQRIRKKVTARSDRIRSSKMVATSKLIGPCKPVLDTKTLLMLRDIATKISPEDPHVCDVCEHAFYNARGIQAHYLKHAKQKLLDNKNGAAEKLSAAVNRVKAAAAALVKSKEPSSKKQSAVADNVEQTTIKKPSPLQWLRPTVLHMLQGVVKGRISDDNPHTCTFCPKVFVRGTGLYFHYLHHKGATRSLAGMNLSPKAKAIATKPVPAKTVPTKTALTKTTPAKPAVTKTPPAAPVPERAMNNNNNSSSSSPIPSPPKKTQTYAVKSLSHHANSNSPPISSSSSSSPAVVVASSNNEATSDADMAALTGRKRDCTFLLRQLEHNTKKLLYHLTKDVQVLQSFGWPQKDASSIVDEILAACNVTPMRRSSPYPSRKLECLRSNVQKLIKFCIRDEVMVAKGWKDKLVDDAVKEIIAAEGFSGYDQERVTF